MHRCGNILLLAVVVVLSGCQGMKKTNRVTLTPQPGRPALSSPAVAPVPPVDEGVRKQLATCLFEAEQLLKLNREKYREPVNHLYQDIRAAKYYAAVASRLSTGATDTLTPMYQFKVNDACNTVSQLLLTEFKQGNTVPEDSR
ncbi:hypothetical protein ABKV56_02625 [Enterobacter hormaechei]